MTDFQGEIKTHYKNLLKFAMRLTKEPDAATDLLHDTIVRVLEKQDYFQEGTSFFSWTSKIMFNLFVTRYRLRVKRESKHDPEPVIAGLLDSGDAHTTCELNEALRAIQELPPHHRDVVVGFMLGCTYDEIALRARVPLGTVRSRLNRARQKLKHEPQ